MEDLVLSGARNVSNERLMLGVADISCILTNCIQYFYHLIFDHSWVSQAGPGDSPPCDTFYKPYWAAPECQLDLFEATVDR